jgi:hypothetical protein
MSVLGLVFVALVSCIAAIFAAWTLVLIVNCRRQHQILIQQNIDLSFVDTSHQFALVQPVLGSERSNYGTARAIIVRSAPATDVTVIHHTASDEEAHVTIDQVTLPVRTTAEWTGSASHSEVTVSINDGDMRHINCSVD